MAKKKLYVKMYRLSRLVGKNKPKHVGLLRARPVKIKILVAGVLCYFTCISLKTTACKGVECCHLPIMYAHHHSSTCGYGKGGFIHDIQERGGSAASSLGIGRFGASLTIGCGDDFSCIFYNFFVGELSFLEFLWTFLVFFPKKLL